MTIEQVQQIMRAIIDQRRIRRAHMDAQRRNGAPAQAGRRVSHLEYIRRSSRIWARHKEQEG